MVRRGPAAAIVSDSPDESAWYDVAAHMKKVYGPMLQQMFGSDDAALAQFVRSQVEPLLTKPFGEVNLSDFITISPPQNGGPRSGGILAEIIAPSGSAMPMRGPLASGASAKRR